MLKFIKKYKIKKKSLNLQWQHKRLQYDKSINSFKKKNRKLTVISK